MKPIWILGFILNLNFLYAVFQIYFHSPVVEINTVYSGHLSSRFNRVVFFVCDGLRADIFFTNPNNHKYLMSLLHAENSVWGISDTRVPTESRPGHIALFAGIYEDPSAIFTGWKKNYVEFDSVFNRSGQSIALGSPDIVDMFAEGAGKGKVYFESYPPNWQDFTKANSSMLDTWVLDRFKRLVAKRQLPSHDKLLIFLHLLGTDNTGHAFKPNSPEYLSSVHVVDSIILNVEQLVNTYYQDDKTLYIFTSDHGMTNWGSHGAGSIDETETPFIIWGTGIRHKNYQTRLKQADFSALIAGSLGIAFPTNSIGRFPSNIWNDLPFAYSALFANFKQTNELMLGKKVIVNCGKLPFVPFSRESRINELWNDSIALVEKEDYVSGIRKLEEGMDVIAEGIEYYNRYDQWIMTSLTVYAFLVWIILIGCTVINVKGSRIQLFSKIHLLDFGASALITLYLAEWSTFRISYIFVPIYLTHLLIATVKDSKWRITRSYVGLGSFFLGGVCMTVVIEVLVLTFYHREMISLGILFNCFWCLTVKRVSPLQKTLWLGSTFGLAIFPTIPMMELAKSPVSLSLGSIFCAIIASFWMKQFSRNPIMPGPKNRDKILIQLEIFLILISSLLIHFPEFILTRLFAWLSIPTMFIIPVLLSSQILSLQFLSIFLGIATPFSYLSLNYEVFFMPTLFITLFIFLKLEISKTGENSSWNEFWFQRIGFCDGERRQMIDLRDSFRLASFHLSFIYLSFFGIGNIASISSFDPSASRCFVSVFSPFVMMALLLVKVICPFLLVACAFRLVMLSWREVERTFLIVLLICQGMALHMFLNVTNVGSWLEIGTSISNYVIVQVTTLFLFLLFYIANILTGMQKISF